MEDDDDINSINVLSNYTITPKLLDGYQTHDELISRTKGPMIRKLSVLGDFIVKQIAITWLAVLDLQYRFFSNICTAMQTFYKVKYMLTNV